MLDLCAQRLLLCALSEGRFWAGGNLIWVVWGGCMRFRSVVEAEVPGGVATHPESEQEDVLVCRVSAVAGEAVRRFCDCVCGRHDGSGGCGVRGVVLLGS